MNSLLDFLRFSDPNAGIVTLGTMFIGLSAAVVGSFAFLRKRALVGDAIAHAILPGIALAFMFTQSKNPFVLMAGALVAGWIAMLLIEGITRNSKLKPDTSIGLILSVFFGFGILLITSIQHTGAGNQAGLDQFLFGKAAAMRKSDLKAYIIVAGVLLVVVLSFYKEFKLISFNPEFARSKGLPVGVLQFVLSSITVLAIATGIQAVGVVLMAALLITPPAAARAWTERLGIMLLISGLLGALSGFVGSYISFTAPRMPTGPWIVMSLSGMALLSLFLAPERGVFARILRQRSNRRKIITENLLKALYHLREEEEEVASFSREEILSKRHFQRFELLQALNILKRKLWITEEVGVITLTLTGADEARRVVRLHRLWEMYLTQRLRMKADHIHPNAETIEHIITPEIEELLLHELNYPQMDPHESPIPYSQQ
jgi:manganese/zinc/iron transport system permease protein